MRITPRLIIAVTLIGLAGIINDFVISYTAYLKTPEFFIACELNKEFVLFLTEGSFPSTLLVTLLGMAFYCYSTLHAYEKKSEYVSFLFAFYFANMLSIFILRTIAGLSWYIGTNWSIINLFQFLTLSFSLVYVSIYIYICIIEPKRELNAVSNPDY